MTYINVTHAGPMWFIFKMSNVLTKFYSYASHKSIQMEFYTIFLGLSHCYEILQRWEIKWFVTRLLLSKKGISLESMLLY